MNKWCSGILIALAIPLSTNAAPVAVSYSATIGFNPSATVGVGGQNAGTLINELFGSGIGSTGTAKVTGVFTYESTAPALNSNSRSAGYINAITGATATIGASTVTADIQDIAANAATSQIGYNKDPSSSIWCVSPGTCLQNNLTFAPTGNLIQVVNNSDFYLNPNGTPAYYYDRDAIALAIGFTPGHSALFPRLSTPSFGDVNVQALSFILISTADKSLVDSVLLPDSASFVTSSEVESSLLTLVFSGPGLENDFTLTGQLNNFTTSPIPEPASWAMFISGLIFVISLIGRNRRYSSPNGRDLRST